MFDTQSVQLSPYSINGLSLKKEILMKNISKSIAATALIAVSSLSFSASGLTVDKKAMGEAGDDFLRTISAKIQRMNYLVNLRRNTQDYFDVLNLLVYLNQSTQIEKKMDILISEMRRNNQLLTKVLAEKKQS